jgi:hypothetical protein
MPYISYKRSHAKACLQRHPAAVDDDLNGVKRRVGKGPDVNAFDLKKKERGGEYK